MIPFSQFLLHELPNLTPDSVVLDIGAHAGNWGRQVVEKYSSTVHFFEPIKRFYAEMKKTLSTHPLWPSMALYPMGVAGETGTAVFKIRGDMSGAFADGEEETVQLIGIADLLNNSVFADKQVACAKINCEGSEYPILEALLDAGLAGRIDVLLVQPHNLLPDHPARWAAIMERMSATHVLIFNEPGIWVGWVRKEIA